MKSPISGSFTAVLAIALCINVITTAAQDRWEPTNGPFTGRIFAVTVLQNQDVLVGVESGGYYRSTDAGLTWSYGGLATRTVRTFFRHSSGALYAGLQTGLRISTDDGATWESPNLPVSMNGFGIAETPSGDVYVGGWGSVVRSTDNGTTWTEVDLGVSSPRVNEMFASSSGAVFAGLHNGGLLMSEDGGATWHQADTLYKYDTFHSFAEIGGTILAYSTSNGFLRSTDDGATWQESQGDMISCNSFIHLYGNVLLAGGQSTVYRSSDLGQNWETASTMPGDFAVTHMAENIEGRIIAGTQWGGIYHSDDGGATWTESSQGFTNTTIMSMAVNSSGDLFIIHPASPPVRSTDKGETWSPVENTTDGDFRLSVGPDDVLYVTRRNEGVYHTTDNGATWTADTAGIPEFTYTCVEANGHGDIYVGGANSECYMLKDGAAIWTDLSGMAGTGYITSFAFTSDAVFATSTQDGLYRSTDRGSTWEKLKNGMNESYVLSASVDPAGDVWVAANHGVYRSTDNGDSWAKAGSNISGTTSAVAFGPEGMIYAATRYAGVFYWDPNISDWVQLEEGLDNPKIRFFVVDGDGTLFAGTDGNGVYKRSAPAVSVGEIPSASGIALSQAYPNPVRAGNSAQVQYALPFAGNITMLLHDALGREVRRISKRVEPGTHIERISTAGLPPGVYYHSVLASGQKRTVMLVVR